MKSGWWLLVGGLSTLLGACGDSSPAQTVEGSGPERVGEQRAALSTYTEDFESARLNGPWPLQWSTQSTNASVALTTTAAFSGGQLARVNGPTGGSTTHYLLGAAPRVDSEQTVNVAIGQSSVHLGLVARRSAPDSYYGCWVGQSLSTERLRVYKVVPGSGPQDLFTVGTSPTAGVATIATSNAWYRLRFKVTQDNTTNPPSTRLQARLWQGPSEPSGWTLDYVDSEPLLQNSAGYNGIKGDDGSAAANRFMYFDDYQLDSVASANVCTSDANCESGRFCSQAGECRMYSDSCSTNVQCGPAQVCQYSACICPPGASGCQVNGGPGPTLVDLKASVPSLQYRPVTFARDTTDYFVLPTQSPVTTAPTSPQLQRANHFIMNVAATQPVTLSVGASGTSAAPHALADLVAYDSSGTFIKRAIIDSALPGPFQNSIDLGSLAAGNYEFDIVPRTAGLKYTVTAPNSSITLAFKGGADLTEAGMNTYFFVPAEVEKALLIGQFDASSGVPHFYAPDGAAVTPTRINSTTFLFDSKGKPGVWRTSFRTSSSRAHFVNLPDLFSFDPNAVIASKRIRTEMTPGAGAPTAITSPNNRYNNRFSFHVASASSPVFTIGNGTSIASPPHIVVRLIDSSGADMAGSPFDINPNGTPQPVSSPLQAGDYELHVTNPSIYNAYSVGVPPGIPFVSVDGYGVAYYYASARSYFTVPAGTPSVRFAAKASSVPIEIYNASGTFVGAPTLLGNNVYEIPNTSAGGIWTINLKNDYWSDIRLLNVPQIIAFNKDQLQTVGPSGPAVCSSDADCSSGKVCGQDNGAHFGLAATTDVCWLPTCCTAEMAPEAGGTFYSTCGDCVGQRTCIGDAPCPSSNPECSDTIPCPSGMQCPAISNGWRYGKPGKWICEPPGCCSDPADFGTSTPECGLCTCTPNCAGKVCGSTTLDDGCGSRCVGVCSPGATGCQVNSDCTAGYMCRSQTCVPTDVCNRPDLAPPDCGPGSLCGPCPVVAAPTCENRQCGTDPITGANCGSCAAGHFCDATGGCALLDDTPPIQVPTLTGTRPVIPDEAPATPLLTGTIAGSFAVTEQGSASYTIPIDVPPGRAGLEPALSIQYTSSTANGALGIGWSLNGFSSITRCAQTYAQDGAPRAVKGDASDLYCLDGKRLVAVGYNEYGTDAESFSKIVAMGDTGTGPQWFKVFGRDGRIGFYGGSSNSRGMLRGAVVGTWYLDRIEDRSKNFLRITYEQTLQDPDGSGLSSTSEVVPRAISYTGYDAEDGDREVVFNYDTNRSDLLTGFRAGGGAMARSKILRSIEARAGNQIVHRYMLGYGAGANQAQRLTSVRECAGPGFDSCRLPTGFTYYDELGFDEGVDRIIPNEDGTSVPPAGFGASGFVHKGENGQDLLTSLVGLQSVNIITPIPQGADVPVSIIPGGGQYAAIAIQVINYLGKTIDTKVQPIAYTWDLFHSPTLTGVWACHPNDAPKGQIAGNGAFGAENVTYDCPDGRYLSVDPTSQFRVPNHEPSRQWLIDLDGDGIQDRLYCVDDPVPDVDWGPMHLDYRLAKAASTAGPQPPTAGTHAQRDGEFPLFGDICNYAAPAQFSVGLDIDNDGSANLLAFDAKLGWSVLSLDRGWQTAPAAGLTIEGNYNYYITLIDANGDGLRDLLALPDPTKFPNDPVGAFSPIVNYNTGRGFIPQVLNVIKDGVSSNSGGTTPTFGAYVVDFDQDGIEDVVFADPDSRGQAAPWRVGHVRGGNFYNDAIQSLVEGPGVLGDFDGDGDIDAFTQAVTIQTSQVAGQTMELRIPQRFRLHSGKGRRQNLLKRIEDGYRHAVDVSYEDTNTLGPVYDKHLSSGTCNWPQRCVARVDHALVSGYVESHLESLSPTPIIDRSYSFQYKGARIDVAGYGWLGFSHKAIHVEDGLGDSLGTTTTEYADPEPWTVGTSTAPYHYLKAGLPVAQREIQPIVGSSITSAGSSHVEVDTTFKYTTALAQSGRPFVYLSRTETQLTDYQLDNVIPMITEVGETQLDEYGNPVDEKTTRTDWSMHNGIASLNPASTTVEHVTRKFEPTYEELDKWLIALPKSVTVESTPPCSGETDCAARRKHRTSTYDYFPGTNLLQFEHRQPGDTELELTTEVTRDSRGNVTSAVATDFFGYARETTMTYDSRYLFPLTVSAVGDGVTHTSQVRFDNRFGTITAHADANGIDETSTYDANGVERIHRGPAGVVHNDYESADQVFVPGGFWVPAVLRVISDKAGGGHTESEIDSFGNVVRTKTVGLDGSDVYQEFGYDYRRRLFLQRRPHLADDLSQGDINYTYDELDRVLTEEYPDGATVKHDYANASTVTAPVGNWNRGAGFEGDSFVRHTDPRGNETIVISNRDGQTVRVVDAEQHLTDYSYAAFGDLERITDNLERMIDFTHDDLGRMRSVTDLARGGTETTGYNAFGDVVYAFDAASRASFMSYDGFGRIETREDADGNTSWIYDGPNPNEIDRLVSVTSSSGQHQTFHYEPRLATSNRGFLQSSTSELYLADAPTNAPPRTLTKTYHYDSFSRLEKVDYPSAGNAPVSVQYNYDTHGHMTQVADAANLSNVYWRLVSADQGYRIKEERLGTHDCGGTPGTLTTRMYEPLTGRPQRIKTECGSSVLQDLSYEYDHGSTYAGSAGNLTSRNDAKLNTHDSYGYDAINRPTTYSPAVGVQTTRYTYDPNGTGSLSWQADVGDYQYDTTKGRDWIQSAGTTSYQHDDVGNIIQRTGPGIPGGSQQIDYTAFDLPKQIRNAGSAPINFEYDAAGSRVVKQGPAGNTFYAGDIYQRMEATTGSSERFMIYAGGRAVAQITKVDGATNANVRYLHDDVLGSINVVSDTAGAVSTRRSYDVFGKDYNPTTETPYGFTGQEMEDDLGLINMHGRMYDPTLGQFTSADPILQQPYSQGLNRFAYVNNSPLNYVDPSGFGSQCRGRCSKGWGGQGIGEGLLGAAIVGGAITTLAAVEGGPTAIGAAGTAVGAGAAATAAASSTTAAAEGGATVSLSAAEGLGALAGGFGSIWLNDVLYNIDQPPSVSLNGNKVNGHGSNGGAVSRGAANPDSFAPVRERGIPPVQERAPRLCESYDCVADNGRFGGAGSSGSWDPSEEAIGPPISSAQLQRLSELLQAARQEVQQRLPRVKLADNLQLGKKIGKHARDFGLNPANPADRQFVVNRIRQITENWDEVRQGQWHPGGGGGSDYLFFRQSADVVVTKSSGDFVTILKGGVNNGWFRAANPLF